MSKKRRVNTTMLNVFIVSLVLHGLALLSLGSYVVYRVVTPPSHSFEAPVVKERIAPKQIQMKAQLQQKTRDTQRLNPKIMVKSPVGIGMSKIEFDASALPVLSAPAGLADFSPIAKNQSTVSGEIELTLPEVSFMGVKTQGERILFCVSAEDRMLEDRNGGVNGYQIVKEEILRQIDVLPPGAVFNVIFYRGSDSMMFNPEGLVAATVDAKKRLRTWMEPINRTAGTHNIRGNIAPKRTDFGFNDAQLRRWLRPLQIALELGSDTVYIIDVEWGYFQKGVKTEEAYAAEMNKWKSSRSGQLWQKMEQDYQKRLDAENAERKKAGQPPKVIGDRNRQIKEWFPDAWEHRPPSPTADNFQPKDIIGYINTVRSELYKARTYKPMVNIILLTSEDATVDEKVEGKPYIGDQVGNFEQMAKQVGGKFKLLRGLKSIQDLTSTPKKPI